MSSDPHYTVYVRLPFNRGDFVDPPVVNWDSSKDKALWKVLSRNPSTSKLDWSEMATRFEVTVPFILQQAAFLYERHLSSVREQMQQIGGKVDKQTPGSKAVAQQPSPGQAPSDDPQEALLGHGLRTRAPLSRNISTQTVTQVNLKTGDATSPKLSYRQLSGAGDGASASQPSRTLATSVKGPTRYTPDHQASSSSSESDVDRRPLRQSQLLRRPRHFARQKPSSRVDSNLDEENEDDEDGPAFFSLPSAKRDKASRDTLRQTTAPEEGSERAQVISSPSASASSIGSAAHATYARPEEREGRRVGGDVTRPSASNKGSEGTPSAMSSSFSDLEDSSVTRSAMEEAFASNLRRQGNVFKR